MSAAALKTNHARGIPSLLQISAPNASNQALNPAINAHGVWSSNSRSGDVFDGTTGVRIIWRRPAQEAGVQRWIRQLEQLCETALLRQVRKCVAVRQIGLEERVELPHAAPALPRQTSPIQCSLSSSIFLISAIALAGFRSFGHASVQFMIV